MIARTVRFHRIPYAEPGDGRVAVDARIEATVAGLGFYLFTVHTVTTDERSETTRDDYLPRLVVKSA
jgi:hypothetical protein